MSTIRGKTSATPNSVEIRYTPHEGWNGSYGVEGPKAAVAPLIQQLAAAGYSVVYRCDQSPKASLVYSTPGNVEPGGGTEVPTLVWEYFANSAEIDLLDKDSNGSIAGTVNINSISEEDKRKIREAIQSPSGDSSPSISGSAAITIYQLMLSGVRSALVDLPVLRVSKLVSGNYPVSASIANAGRLITTSTLRTMESIPSGLLFDLPNSSTITRGSISLEYAWRKHFPGCQQAGGYRWNITQEWSWGLWPRPLFGTPL